MIRPTLAKVVGVAAALALSLSACGGVNSNAASKNTAADSASDACKSTAGITDKSIDLSVLSDLSGPIAPGGEPAAAGAQAFFNYANQNPDKLGGRTVNLTVKDTQYDPQKAIAAYREVSANTVGFPLSFGVTNTNAIATQAQAACMPVVASAGSKADERPGINYGGSSYDDSVVNLMDYYVNDQHHKNARVAVFYMSGSYGEGAVKALKWLEPKLGFKLVAEQSFAPTDKSFTGQLSAIQAAKPDVVLMASAGAATFGFFGAAQAAGVKWDWLGLQGAYIPAVFDLPIGPAFAKDVTIVYGAPLAQTGGDQISAALAELKKDFPKDADNVTALLGWQAAYIFYSAMVKAYDDNNLTRGGIRDALSTLNIPSGGMGPEQLVYDPTSDTPAVPYNSNLITVPDKTAPGGLKIVKNWFQSDLVDQYNAGN